MTTDTDRHHLPSAYDVKANRRRRQAEAKLFAAVQLGAVFSAHLDGTKYRVVNARGTVHEGLSIREAEMVASFALAAFREGRATA